MGALLTLVVLAGLLSGAPVSHASTAVPSDVRLVSSWTDPLTGFVWDRYQQYAAPRNVFVDGGQLVVIRKGSRVVDQGGAYYPGLRVTAAPRLSASEAASTAVSKIPAGAASSSSDALTRTTQLRVDPTTGAQFYRVASSAPGTLLYQDIDANTGAVLAAWSGIQTDAPGTGRGVKQDDLGHRDLKNLAGSDVLAGPTALTSAGDGAYRMLSADSELVVSDANDANSYPSAAIADTDDIWAGGRQAAAVDAQYYAALTANFYSTKFGVGMTTMSCPIAGDPDPTHRAPLGPIHSIVHYRRYSSQSYDNAFWDEFNKVMVYGDGNGTTDGQFSGAQDVVSHELSHAVTSCHAGLDYIKESGALNEAFSDIMATAAEFEFEEPNSSNCIREAGQASCADWWIAEDAIIGGSDHAFRSLSTPELLGQPAHYADRAYANTSLNNCVSFNDYCGVHTNSGIANHAFYLLANGGRNSRCSGPTDTQADCDVVVPGVGIDHAANIFLRGWFALSNTSKFCDARRESIGQAQSLADAATPGYSQADVSATELAWDAVGVYCPAGSTGFSVAAASRSTAAKPGGSASVTLNVSRSGSTAPITFTASGSAAAWASFTPASAPNGTTSVQLDFDLPGDAASGTYLVTVAANDGTDTKHIPVVLIVDDDNPTVSVTDVQLVAGALVAADGHVPLNVLWTATDATSGVASGTLIVDSATLDPSATSPVSYPSTDGSHSIQVEATDAAGNSATSTALPLTRTSIQETPSASVVYTKTTSWITSTSPSPWAGTTRFSKTNGATATVTFTGTDIAWVSNKAPKRGKAKVFIDGVQKAVVDLKSATTASRVIVYVASGLASGTHTLKIYVNGTSGRPRVDVDGFIVLS